MFLMRGLVVLAALASCGEPIRDFLDPNFGTYGATLFLNYESTVMVGAGDNAVVNSSSLLQNQTPFLSYNVFDINRDKTNAKITDELTQILLPYNILVTDKRPTAGPYHMILLTDDRGTEIGCPNCISMSSRPCDPATAPASNVGFVFGGSIPGTGLPVHMATSQIVSMLGLFVSIPMSVQVADCMCYVETPCINSLIAMPNACTIGGEGTPVSTTQSCPTSEATMDVNAKFVDAFGIAIDR